VLQLLTYVSSISNNTYSGSLLPAQRLGENVVNLISLLVSLILGFQMTCGPIAFAAAEISATGSGGVQGQAKCNKIGALLLADGLAIMNGSTIAITAHASSGHSDSQLNGKIFKAEQAPGGAVKAYAWFTDGPGLSQLDSKICAERVDLMDGTRVPGPISSITPDQVTAGGTSYPMSQVSAIHSSRVFQFSSNAGKISFDSTCIKAPGETKVKAKGKGITGKQVLIGLVIVAIVACAIAIPVALASSGHGHSNPPPSSGGGGSQTSAPSGPVNTAGGFRGFHRHSSSSNSSSTTGGSGFSRGSS
jgi:hypothetical protein